MIVRCIAAMKFQVGLVLHLFDHAQDLIDWAYFKIQYAHFQYRCVFGMNNLRVIANPIENICSKLNTYAYYRYYHLLLTHLLICYDIDTNTI